MIPTLVLLFAIFIPKATSVDPWQTWTIMFFWPVLWLVLAFVAWGILRRREKQEELQSQEGSSRG
jgi:membrane protein implicated in regulation of membrane protease activity